MNHALNTIGESKVVAIIRGIPLAYASDVVAKLQLGGIKCVEVTMDSPAPLTVINQLKERFGDELLVGAGTVLDAETARVAILAGADFLLAPTLNLPMIEMCHRYSKLAVPGVFTPTEALTAWDAGAQLLKIFPASIAGPQYLKDVLGPLKQLRLMPVGGVNALNAKAYLAAGAFAVGIGGSLVDSALLEPGDLSHLTERAFKLMNGIN